MLSHYTWGQFLLFVVVLVGLYYLGVGLLYYREELTALLRGRATASRPGPGATEAPPALVRTASAFAAPGPAPAVAKERVSELETGGAADNLPEPATPLVAGTLPDSTGAKGTDEAAAGEVPMATEAASAAAQEQHLDEQRVDEQLDEADQALAELIRQAAAPGQQPAAPTESAAPAAAATSSDSEAEGNQMFIDSSNNQTIIIETVEATIDVEGEPAYEAALPTEADPLDVFDEPLASPLDLLPAEPTPLVEADSLAAFLAGVQRDAQLPVPAELLGTSLAAQMADLTRQNQQELLALFGQEA